MFADEAVIFVKCGNGGNGCVSFRREKYVPHGGPDGGNGGKGGDGIFSVSGKIDTLLDLTSRVKHIAENGSHGKGSTKRGRDGKDLIIDLPRGTIVKDKESGRVLKDMSTVDKSIVIARGGRGGRGNKYFASSINQVPRQAEKGKQGEERWLILELKLLAEDRKSTRLNSSHSQISFSFFFVNDTPTTEIYPLSLHDALPILSIRFHVRLKKANKVKSDG